MTEKLSSDELLKIEWFDRNFSEVKENIAKVCAEIGKNVDDIILLAATKTVPAAVINHAMDEGIGFIGENRVQEFLSKKDDLKATAHRHFIGHLQTNKVKDIVDEVEMIESVHSVKLAKEIDKQCKSCGKVMEILLEVNIGGEESKSGFTPQEVVSAAEEIAKMPNVSIKGLMTIPPICETKEKSSEYFAQMYKLFIDIRDKKLDNVNILYLSMGMSGDYVEAIRNGANIIRLGTCLFGQRNYNN